jgi:hypothetical protein
MKTLEDRIRAATAATAEEIAPGTVRPLALHGRVPSGRCTRAGHAAGPGRRSARWPRVLIPVAAAASVIAVVAGSLAVAGGVQARRLRAPAAEAAPLAAVPPYYVMLTGNNPDPTVLQPEHAVIRATATGAVRSAIAPPSPYGTFISVAGDADGRTFVLAAEKWVVDHVDGGASQQGAPVKFFLLRIAASGRASLTPLPIPEEPASADLAGIALSPDGSKLAVAIDGPNGGSARIQVLATATGAEQDWTWPGGGQITNNSGGRGQVLSWAADGRTVAFQLWRGNNIYIGLADTATPRSGRLVVNFAGQATDSARGHLWLSGSSALITPDGTAIVCAVASVGQGKPDGYEFLEFSTRNGAPMAIFAPPSSITDRGLQNEDVLWTNASGTGLIVTANVPAAKPGTSRLQIGVVTLRASGLPTFTPLPGEQFASELFSYPVW